MVGFPPSLAHLKTTLLTNNYHKNTDTQCTDSQAEERVLRDRRGRVSGPLRPQRETGTVSKELHDVFSSLLFCPLGFALPDLSQKDLGLFWSLKPNKFPELFESNIHTSVSQCMKMSWGKPMRSVAYFHPKYSQRHQYTGFWRWPESTVNKEAWDGCDRLPSLIFAWSTKTSLKWTPDTSKD